MKRLFFLIVLVFLVSNNSYAVSYNSDPKIFITELVDDIMEKRKDLKELEEELNKHKDKITSDQVGES